MNKYLTAYELAVGKRSEKPQEWEGNERSEWGQALQETIAKRFAEHFGVKIRQLSAYATIEDFGVGASFDYEIVGSLAAAGANEVQQAYLDHGPGVLEIKNVDGLIYRNEWEDDEAPPHIELQVQTQLMCIGRHWGMIAVLVGGNRLVTLYREADAEVWAVIGKKVREFWKNTRAGVFPPLTLPQDAELVAAMFKYSDPDKLLDWQDREDIQALCKEYVHAAALEKHGKQNKDSTKAKILMLIGNAERVLVDGFNLSAGTVSEAEIPAYTRSAYRNLRVTEKKPPKLKDQRNE
jgi:predicted phage-related endonuclease